MRPGDNPRGARSPKLANAYRSVSRALDVKLRGTNQQSNTGLWHLNSALTGNVGSEFNTYSPKRVSGYTLGYGRINNRSGGDAICGFGARVPNYMWTAGLWADGTTTFTDDTTDWQDRDTNDFALGTAATANDGFCIFSDIPFNCVSINVTTASSGGSQVGAVSYSLGTGSWSSAMANLFIQDGLATFYGTGENLIVFSQPADWGKTTGGEGTGVPIGKYGIRVRCTTAATNAALGLAGEVWNIYLPTEKVTDNTTLEYYGSPELAMPYADALGALISSVTATQSHGTLVFSPGSAFGGI